MKPTLIANCEAQYRLIKSNISHCTTYFQIEQIRACLRLFMEVYFDCSIGATCHQMLQQDIRIKEGELILNQSRYPNK